MHNVIKVQSLLRLCGRNIWMHPKLLTNVRVRRGERRLVVLVGRRRGLPHTARWVHESHLGWGRLLGGKVGEGRPEGDCPDEEGDVDVEVEGHRAGVNLELKMQCPSDVVTPLIKCKLVLKANFV